MRKDLEEFLKEAREKARGRTLIPVWSPQEIGEELYGVVADIIPNPWDSSVQTYVVRTADGKEFMTPRNTVLVDLLAEFNPHIGDYIYIKYVGRGKERKGRSAPKLFEVYVKHVEESTPIEMQAGGKEQEQTPKVETAESLETVGEEKELEKLEKSRVDIEALRRVVATIGELYGYPTIERFEHILRSKGFDLSAEDVEKLLPDMVSVSKHGVKIRRPK